jgi:LuxR family maltose regulon positive regulatory protein
VADEANTLSILRTKLHRPPIPRDHVHRARLLERLEERRYRPLTLVSAPPGYGKSTLVSCWLDGCETPFGWLSLDEHDNDLHQFLTYFVAAVQSRHGTEFPDAFSKTMTLINAPILPPIPVLASSLTNELDSIEQDFILVLDDIHCIQDKSVHDLLKMLLHHPPRPMHLVLIGRRDPPLPMSKLRGRDQVTEIRTLDLSFTTAETAEFLQGALEEQVDVSTAAALAQRAEGWVTGLRLAVLAVRGHHDTIGKLLELKGTTVYVMDYLIKEVLDAQLPVIRRYLLSTSILDRFCAPLCGALCGPDLEAGEGEIDGQGFVTSVQQGNLLVIPLDTENRWFRYHHLFQHLLQDHLKRRYSSEEIATLHSRASEWFESQGLLTESIEHALAAGDAVRAADIVEQYRHDQHEAGRWHVVERWLFRLPDEIKKKRAPLLFAEAWIAYLRFQLERIPSLVEQAESLIDSNTAEPSLLGELNFFRGNLFYWQGEAQISAQLLEEALAQTPDKQIHVKSNIELILGLARQMIGQKEFAIQAFDDRIRASDASEGFYLAYLIGGLTFVHLIAGELSQARFQAQRLQTVSGEFGNSNTEAWGSYLQACAYLHACELDRASQHFAVAAHQRYTLDTRAVIDAMAGLALAQQLNKKPDEAEGVVESLMEFALELNVPQYLSLAHSCRARLSLLRGDLASAIKWAPSIDESPAPSVLFTWLEIPSITQARVLIADGTGPNLIKATELLHMLRRMAQAYRFTNQIIEVAVLQSMALEKLGRSDEALIVLEEVVALAGPGGWVRPFIEAGPPMADLLKQLQRQNVAVDYIQRILAAIRDDEQVIVEAAHEQPIASPPQPVRPSVSPQSMLEPLTNRELDILELLAQRLQNKEIAEKLSISPTTVKTHLQNIFQKLQVSNRREAVESAEALGILSRP